MKSYGREDEDKNFSIKLTEKKRSRRDNKW